MESATITGARDSRVNPEVLFVSAEGKRKRKKHKPYYTAPHMTMSTPLILRIRERPYFVRPTGRMSYSPLWITVKKPYTLRDKCGRNSVHAGITTKFPPSLQ